MKSNRQNAIQAAGLALIISAAYLISQLAAQAPGGAGGRNLEGPRTDDRRTQLPDPLKQKAWQPLGVILMAKALEAAPGDDALRKLLKERYNTAVQGLKARKAYYDDGKVSWDSLAPAFSKVRDSRLELNQGPVDQLAVLELAVESAQEVEARLRAEWAVGRSTEEDAIAARYNRLGAEIQLLRAKEKLTSKTPR